MSNINDTIKRVAKELKSDGKSKVTLADEAGDIPEVAEAILTNAAIKAKVKVDIRVHKKSATATVVDAE